jgi:subtilisin-like proprotein convertase family protein
VIPVAGIGLPIFKVTMSIDGTECSTDAGSPTVGIDHTFVQDLLITLQSPAGTRVAVISFVDTSGNNFCQVVLDDAAAVSIQTVAASAAPFTGTWRPNAPLSAFAGEDANGNWTLFVQDFAAQDTGSIRAWTINITDKSAAPIPTLSEWGMILMCGLMALIGLSYIQWRGRRRV